MRDSQPSTRFQTNWKKSENIRLFDEEVFIRLYEP